MRNDKRPSSSVLTKPSSKKGKIEKETPEDSKISDYHLSGNNPLPPAFTYKNDRYVRSLLEKDSKEGGWAYGCKYRCAGKSLFMKAIIAYDKEKKMMAQREPEMQERASEVTGGAVIEVLATANREQNGGMWSAIIMPCYDMTLDAYLSAFPTLDTTRRKAILIEIALALDKLALHDIIHGDIKGDNVLMNMNENGKPVIIDLGLACDLKLPLEELPHFGPADHFGFDCNLDVYGGYKDEKRREVIEWVRTLLPIASGESRLGTSGDDILQCHLDELDAFVEIHGKFIFAQRNPYMLGILALYVMFGNWQKWFTDLKTMYPTPENIREIAAKMYNCTSYGLTYEEAFESAEIVLNMCTPNLEERKNEKWFVYKCKGGHASVGSVF